MDRGVYVNQTDYVTTMFLGKIDAAINFLFSKSNQNLIVKFI